MLNPRVLQAFEMRRQGLKDVDIARELGVTSQTVGTDLRNLRDAFRGTKVSGDAELAAAVQTVLDGAIRLARDRLIKSLKSGQATWELRDAWASMLHVGALDITRLLSEAQEVAMGQFVDALKEQPDLLRQLKASKDPVGPYVEDVLDMMRKKLPGGSE